MLIDTFSWLAVLSPLIRVGLYNSKRLSAAIVAVRVNFSFLCQSQQSTDVLDPKSQIQQNPISLCRRQFDGPRCFDEIVEGTEIRQRNREQFFFSSMKIFSLGTRHQNKEIKAQRGALLPSIERCATPFRSRSTKSLCGR